MIKFAKIGLVLSLAIAVSGCSTIVFTNGEPVSTEQYSSWHHNLAYSLYEYSEPVNPNASCDQGWSQITVEKDIITALAGGIDEAILLVDVWDPWAVSVNCSR